MIETMEFPTPLAAFALLACSTAHNQEADLKTASQQASTSQLNALKSRSVYTQLDQQAVAQLASSARLRWPKQLADFTYQDTQHFSGGGASHWISIWLHHGTGLEFALLPGGRFQMGSPPGEEGHRPDEKQHWVTLDPFMVARTECTFGAWTQGSKVAGKVGAPFAGSNRLPISGVGPPDVEFWCREAELSFPTEAQWEYMCRAGTTSAWTMGSVRSDTASFANLGSLECPDEWHQVPGITESWLDGYGMEPAPVGMFASNAFGLFDVHGNLNEWCRDEYFDYLEVQPEPGTGARLGHSGERIARGGNNGGNALAARSAKRLTTGPGVLPRGGGNHGFGFRPSVDLPF